MGVPAFYRWLSEKYPKIVQDVVEDRVHLDAFSHQPAPLDWRSPNPSGLECDNLYIDMNGIIHPCSHPENGPQPQSEVEMFENVCHYVDRLVRAIRPRRLLYLAVDGVAPRAKMNQQRARRFRAAEEARELAEIQQQVRENMGHAEKKPALTVAPWDSNVITPGTKFMTNMSDYLRFYIRKRLQEDPAWQHLIVLWSDASIPGEGEHKLMAHLRRQRSQPGYDPNAVHVLHGLDADLIMLGLATHEAHFYICREQVVFGRKSVEMMEERQRESGFTDQQELLNQAAGAEAMNLRENQQTPLQRISIPILREYIAAEFEQCLRPDYLSFPPSLERLIDDIVFLCFFVGNDFLPHLPSLDIRDGGLDFLFNVYKRILPSLGDYITKSGGQVNLSHVDVILDQVGALEDYVFSMKHETEERNKKFQQDRKDRDKQQRLQSGGRKITGDAPPPVEPTPPEPRNRMGRSAKILESPDKKSVVALSRKHKAKEEARHAKKIKHMEMEDNAKAALALKQSLVGSGSDVLVGVESTVVKEEVNGGEQDGANAEMADAVESENVESADKVSSQPLSAVSGDTTSPGHKRTHDDISTDIVSSAAVSATLATSNDSDDIGDAELEGNAGAAVDDDELDENLPKLEESVVKELDPVAAQQFKDKVQATIRQKLDEHAKNVEDKVRLHEPGWKDRYYRDKCKADDVEKHGGREHLFRSYVMGLCWVMKYYYDGCPSWKWYYPFHYAPFASDLKNIERFQNDCRAFEQNTPFNPVEQLMAVLPPDSSHAIPTASRWLMLDRESPILDFYPTTVPVDPNGKAMPWLWVVLLPFIEEDRLLAAMSPTMSKWSKEELLCNARGMDDGYLYAHAAHPFAKKLLTIVDGKTATASKARLTDSASHGVKGLTGSVRPPLSHELFPLGDEVTVPLPPTSNTLSAGTSSVFSDKLYSNEVVVAAFTEPPKLSHKSILLPGVKQLPPVLTADDKVIRRPRLNRFGGTIANMGGESNNQSHQKGFGSMNISNYERQLAQQNGRGNQMNQPGTRSWGSMEPAINTRRPLPPPMPQIPHVANPFLAQNRPNGQPLWQGQMQAAPQPELHPNMQQSWQQHAPYQQNIPQQQYQQQTSSNYRQQPQYPQYQQGGGYQQQQQQQHGGWSQQYPPHQANPAQQQQRPPQQGFNFRSYNAGGPPQQQGYAPHAASRPPASADVMANLKQQLANTLNKNKR